jgi:mono/diheme cytochrome c family protein
MAMTRVKLVVIVVAAALCGLCAACGASSPRPATRTAIWAPARAFGAVLFARNCAACHSLIGNESERKQGGDLIGYRMTRAQMALMTRTMPTRALSDAEVQSIVSYVLAAQRRNGS